MLDRTVFKNVLHDLEVYTEKEKQIYDLGIDITEVTDGIIDSLLNLLKETTNNNTDLFSYFCYETNFGKNWEPEMVVDEDGADIPLRTADELYDILLKDEEERNYKD